MNRELHVYTPPFASFFWRKYFNQLNPFLKPKVKSQTGGPTPPPFALEFFFFLGKSFALAISIEAVNEWGPTKPMIRMSHQRTS